MHDHTKLEQKNSPKSLKSIVNTPFKKFIFSFQILSWFIIVGSPIIGGLFAKAFNLKAAATGSLIFGVFIVGELLFYATLAFLGKELILIIKDKSKLWFKLFRSKKTESQ